MTNHLLRLGLILCIGLSTSASKAIEVHDDLVRKFSVCDSSLFLEFKRNESTWSKVAPMARNGDSAWIEVADRRDDKSNEVAFSASVSASGLELLSYFDEMLDLGPAGRYHSWGFTATGDIVSVQKKIGTLVADSVRLRHDGTVFVRTELKVGNGPWQKVNTANAAVGLTQVERVFMIEQHETRPKVVRLTCSLQGSVSANTLSEIRPDIGVQGKEK